MRLYTSTPITQNADIQLPEDVAHHLRVLRSAPGDQIVLFDGQGGEHDAVLTDISKKSAHARALAFRPDDRTSSLHTHLGQVMSRGERMDYAIQKSTELGVSEITPLTSERCELKLRGEERADKKLEHWRRIAIAACEQSGRNRLPVIHAPVSIEEWQTRVETDLKLVLAPAVSGSLAHEGVVNKVALLIGPEGGLSEREIAAACEHGFRPWQIGPRVMRTETAPVAALAILQQYFGDFR